MARRPGVELVLARPPDAVFSHLSLELLELGLLLVLIFLDLLLRFGLGVPHSLRAVCRAYIRIKSTGAG